MGGVSTSRVCRVVVDVLAVERVFDYLVPAELAELLEVGTIVRVPLHGRRVRAWVIADGVKSEAPPDRLRPLLGVVSAGPPADVVDLTAWAAWRFAGPRLPLLRAASPAAIVSPRPGSGEPPVCRAVPEPRGEVAGLAADVAQHRVAVVRWPPAGDIAELVAALLPSTGSSLVVVPDARAAVLARQLARAGFPALAFGSDGRPRERAAAWARARRGNAAVIGGRTALLAPVPDLEVVVVLDDGVEALKEERSPTWHARDLALERARRAGARVVLTSPAPPLEALAAGPLLRPSRTAERAGWPVLEVVDRRQDPPGLGLFSTRVVAVLRAAVDGGDGAARAVCVLNRRGRARLLGCSTCGDLARCERCQAAVAESVDGDGDGHALVCRACGATRPRLCARCGGAQLRILRAGVSRVREDLAALLPRVGVALVDAGTEKLTAEPVLIGTEAVLHRVDPDQIGKVAVVAFLDFDQELLAPRFRAGEQALWLLIRAARLVGPRAAGGRVLVQTRLPRHEVLEAAVRADPGVLAAAEEPRRRLLGLPPFAALARLSGEAAALEAAAAALRQAGTEMSWAGAGGGDLLARAPTAGALADSLAVALAAGRPAGRLRADVDPLRV